MGFQNNGQAGWKVLEQDYLDDTTITGKIMPNISQISPQAIIDGTVNSVTFNDTVNIAPTGGINNDVWYNQPENKLYKKLAGTWTELTDRVSNDFYVAPVTNLASCPLP